MYKILDLEKHNHFKFQDGKRIVGYQWSAILDQVICSFCEGRDGLRISANDAEYYTYMPPVHPRCRCRWLNLTQDMVGILESTWFKPEDSLIDKYAPFLFIIPFKGKKKGSAGISPFAPESPELVFNPNNVFSIEQYIKETEMQNIENTIQEIKVREEKKKHVWIVYFVDELGRTVVDKEVEEGNEIYFSQGEIRRIKEKAVKYLISSGNSLVEDQIKKLFGFERREF